MRINKYLATAGIASRRKAEELVKAGEIRVNGKKITDLATDIKDTDIVLCAGEKVKIATEFEYYKLHKPKGYVSTVEDDKGRKTVMELMRGVHTRVFPVGRLDYDTEGLLLMTNDGDITNILTHPKSEVKKTYVCQVEGDMTGDEIKKLCSGVDIGGYVTKPCSIELVGKEEKGARLKITISEGKNRQIRKMFESIGRSILFLKRAQIGEIHLGGLSRGEYAPLNPKELKYLKSLKQ